MPNITIFSGLNNLCKSPTQAMIFTHILQQIIKGKTDDGISIESLQERFSLSEEEVRENLTALEEHGFIRSVNPANGESDSLDDASSFIPAKLQITLNCVREEQGKLALEEGGASTAPLTREKKGSQTIQVAGTFYSVSITRETEEDRDGTLDYSLVITAYDNEGDEPIIKVEDEFPNQDQAWKFWDEYAEGLRTEIPVGKPGTIEEWAEKLPESGEIRVKTREFYELLSLADAELICTFDEHALTLRRAFSCEDAIIVEDPNGESFYETQNSFEWYVKSLEDQCDGGTPELYIDPVAFEIVRLYLDKGPVDGNEEAMAFGHTTWLRSQNDEFALKELYGKVVDEALSFARMAIGASHLFQTVSYLALEHALDELGLSMPSNWEPDDEGYDILKAVADEYRSMNAAQYIDIQSLPDVTEEQASEAARAQFEAAHAEDLAPKRGRGRPRKETNEVTIPNIGSEQGEASKGEGEPISEPSVVQTQEDEPPF